MQFKLQQASFSESDGEDDLLIPTNQMINEYNRQYSMIVQQIQNFLKQVKQSVQKFVAFHNFGVNLNLSSLLETFIHTEKHFKDKCQSSSNPKQTAKLKYQNTFKRLMQRMSDLLQDLLECEIEFKKQYFGLNTKPILNSNTNIRARARSPQNYQNYSVASLTNSSKSQKIKKVNYKIEEEKEEKREAELRVTLNEKLKPKPAQIQSQCKQEYSTTENLYRLNEKLDRLLGDMKSVRVRQDRLIQLFDLNRIKKIHSAYQEETPFISTDISEIQHNNSSEQEEVQDLLESYRAIRKKSDSFTEHGEIKHGNFIKKTTTFIEEQINFNE